MGAKDSKRACLSYEDALKRMTDAEFKRVCEAFKRLTGNGQLLSRHAFQQNVLGEGVPTSVAEWLYVACGGTPRGIALRDLICGLVLLTKGTQEEKIKFLWTLYCNDAGTHITRNEFQHALQIEGTLPSPKQHIQRNSTSSKCWDRTLISLFGEGQERVTFDHFRAWINFNKEATVLSKWLLGDPCVTLSSELETPTFYQTLAGVTHLEEQDICELEKCFWCLQGTSPSGQLDLLCISALVSPPVPASACYGLFRALDVNGDGHIDFKELCCGISAACRGPTAERMKFCFKMFDIDRDGLLNSKELQHMIEVLVFVAQSEANVDSVLHTLQTKLNDEKALSQEDFLIWSLSETDLVNPLLELLFQVCHVALGLRPYCRHHEHQIVTGWLKREEQRGYRVGQFWYLIATDWWQTWLSYTTASRNNLDHCTCRPGSEIKTAVEEGIVCDESFTSNSTESMGDLLSRGDSCSIASSSGVSSSSGTGTKRMCMPPGPIDNSSLVAEPQYKVSTLTGEGGRLKRDQTLVQRRDFELIPDSLWKALALWYGGPLPLPRQVIRPPDNDDVDLELYPLNLLILRHQSGGGYAAPLGGGGGNGNNNMAPLPSPRRYVAHTAAFSRLATVKQVIEFLSMRLSLKIDDVRLWHICKDVPILLEDEGLTLQKLGIGEGAQVLLEVRNKDLTWPEELGALSAGTQERRPPGATGLHNLGNTCFMNAALQAVSNTKPLTKYFQRDSQLSELNTSNPLGTRGQVARRYAELCKELWAGSARSVAPLKLRWCVTRHAPHLGGGGQHDSQELLAWLLDALHEDLNRVTNKRYTELQDSNGRPDEVVAAEAWQQHLARDHSIITDLFYGQLKSKVTCQTCGHESVRFDAFNLLSLPLPMESFTLCEVLVITLDGMTPVKYGLRLNSEAKYLELKQQLKTLSGISPDRLLLAEVGHSQIRHILSDDGRINAASATELLAYELPDAAAVCVELDPPGSPLARSPEVSSGSTLCMPSILCFKFLQTTTSSPNGGTTNGSGTSSPKSSTKIMSETNVPLVDSTAINSNNKINNSIPNGGIDHHHSNHTNNVYSKGRSASVVYTDAPSLSKTPNYIIAVHRKCVRQETYFLSQHKTKPSLFGVPLLLGCSPTTTCQELYEAVWGQVNRLLSPMPQGDQTNHATDCDDSLGYEFPFTLRTVVAGGQICALCQWTSFCRGCLLECRPDKILFEECKVNGYCNLMIAIDWDPTALHLRYQSSREKVWLEHESVQICRKLHTEPIDLDYCLRAFTSEERLETKYHCSSCQDKQPATKKLQIWRLPPILIIHLKRFDYVNSKWVKTQKVVNFPFTDFDPTGYLASVPQETVYRHRQLQQQEQLHQNLAAHHQLSPISPQPSNNEVKIEGGGGGDSGGGEALSNASAPKSPLPAAKSNARERLESTSLLKSPVLDEDLQDFHQHRLQTGQDPFDLKYQLYAVVCHSGLLNGGHYISYACNPNGSWYCYNDSSCREIDKVVATEVKPPSIDTSAAYILFYERSGLDYRNMLPDVPAAGHASSATDLDLDDGDAKQSCTVQ